MTKHSFSTIIPKKILTFGIALTLFATTAFAGEHQLTTSITTNRDTTISLELLTTTFKSPLDQLSSEVSIKSTTNKTDSFQISSTVTKTIYKSNLFHTHIELNPSIKLQNSTISPKFSYKIEGDALYGLISYSLNEKYPTISLSKPFSLLHKNSRVGTTLNEKTLSLWVSSYTTRELTTTLSYKLPINETAFSFYLVKENSSIFNEIAFSDSNISDLLKIDVKHYFNKGNLTINTETNFSDYSFTALLNLRNGIKSKIECNNHSLSENIEYSNKNFSATLEAGKHISLELEYTLMDSSISFKVSNEGSVISTSHSW